MRKQTRTLIRGFLAGAVLLALAGCSAILGGELTILNTSPADGATGVAIDTVITVELDGRIPDGDLSQLVSVLEGSATVSAAYALDGQTLTITPSAPLALGTEYTVSTDTGSAGFTTAPLQVTVSSGEGPLSTASASLDGSEFTADTSGVLQASGALEEGGTLTVAAPFFVPATIDISDATLVGGVYDASVELSPYIFVPDFGNNRVVRLPAVDAPAAAFESITSVVHGGGTYNLQGPIYVQADYQNGVLYVLDGPGTSGEIANNGNGPTGPQSVLRLADFPPAADGSDADYVSLVNALGTGTDLESAQQLAVQSDGSVILANLFNGRLVRIPQTFSAAGISTSTDTFQDDALGIVTQSNGSIIVAGGRSINTPDAEVFSAFDATATAFTAQLSPNSVINPSRMAVDASDRVYIAGSGDPDGGEPDGRIFRFTSDGSSLVSYGSYDTDGSEGAGEFDQPLVLGILPDQRLYIVDANDDRLVSIDLGVFDGGSAGWQESAADAGFDFGFWFNYS